MVAGLATMDHDVAVRLLERERELDVLRETLRDVRRGPGVGIALSGDSGTGKSSVVAAALGETTGLRVLRGQCDPLGTPRPLGPFRGLGLPRLDALVSAEDVRLSEAAEAALGELGAEPTVLVVEDLHWADAASADVLRYLVRRVETVPLAILLTYRDVEVGPRHPARQLLGDFATLDGLRTLALRPLTVDGVATAVEGTGLDPVRVHALTGGNPFYVSQVALEPDRPLPTSVRDTVLARLAEIEPEDLETLQLIACSPDRLDERVLPLLDVDLGALHRLDGTTLLTHTEDGIAFRHELARQAVDSTIPPGGAPRLHQRLLTSLERVEPLDPAALTHHAVAARDTERTLRYARAAAAEAVGAGSNTEAAAFLEIALAHLPSTAPAPDRAELLVLLAQQLYLTARLDEAAASARAAIPLWREAGRLDGVARAQAALAVLEYQSGRRAPSTRYAAQAREIALEVGDPATIGRVFADAGMLAVIASDLDLAVACAEQAERAGRDGGLEEFVVAGRMLRVAVDTLSEVDGARDHLVAAVEAARTHRWDELAWRGYIVLTIYEMERGRQRAAQHVIDEALAFTVERDLGTARLWHLSLRATVHALAGRWNAAREDAAEVVASGALEGSLWPHYAQAMTALRVGDQDPTPFFDRAWQIALTIDEPGRYLPVLSGLAETMWLTGTPDPRVTDFAVAHLARLSAPADKAWAGGELLVWLRRLGLDVPAPADLPAPFVAELEGRHQEAARWWRELGHPFAEAMAYADSPVPEDRVRAVSLLDRLGAIATADRLRRKLRLSGVGSVPTRPLESTRANPGGLTNRQLEVARLLARGFTNGEIAAQAFISPKTAEHHVAAVLMKLGLTSRREVVQHAAELGLD